MKLRFRSDFDPIGLSWGGPDEPQSETCSICDAPLGEAPLRMWREDEWAVCFCDACVERWIEVVK